MPDIASRAIAPQEIAVLEAALTEANLKPIPEDLLKSINALRVVDRCDCGCPSIDFVRTPAKAGRLADGTGSTPSGGLVGLIVWGDDKQIAGLEVYDLGAGPDDLVLPVVESVKSFRASAV